MSTSDEEQWDPDQFLADIQAYAARVIVVDANDEVVNRGDLTLHYTAKEGIVVDGLVAGDRLYVDGVMRYAARCGVTLAGANGEHVLDVYLRG